MKFRALIRDWLDPLPPVVQRPSGQVRDRDFNAEPGLLETLFACGSDGRMYELPPEDAKRLRPVFLRDPRAVRNEQIAARRRAARGETDAPITIVGANWDDQADAARGYPAFQGVPGRDF